MLQNLKNSLLILFLWLSHEGMQAQDYHIVYSIEVTGTYAKNVKNMLPNKLHLYIGKQKTLSYLEGGLANSMKMISDKETGEAFLLRFTEKKYAKIPHSGKNDSLQWKKMPETKKISGFICQRYQLFIEQEVLGSYKQDIWLTQEIPITFGKARTQLHFPEKNGFPVKMNLDMGMYLLSYTLIECQKQELNPSLFDISSDFTEEIFNPNKIGRDVLH